MDSGSAELFSMHTCPIFIEVSFLDLSSSPLYPRDVFKPKSEDHKVTGSKPVSADMLFVDYPVPGVVRAKSWKVGLWCNVRVSDDMPPRTSQ